MLIYKNSVLKYYNNKQKKMIIMKKLMKMFRLLRLRKLPTTLQVNCTMKKLFYFTLFNKLATI